MNRAHEAAETETEATLTPLEFQQFRDFLYSRSGLHFGENKKFLVESRLQRRMKALGLGGVSEYLALVTSPTRGARELTELLDIITVHETSFFRNRPQLDAFQKRILPELMRGQARGGRQRLRLWSAACSTGEEPYTLAMMILETLGAEAPKWDVRILGTDISRAVVEQARRGVYTRYSFRTTPAYFIQKYFTVEGPDAFRLNDEVKRMVEFRLLNFADEAHMRLMRSFHVVFCRNALIYFDRDAKARFVAHFAQALEPGGYFFVGHSESLHGISDAFKLIHFAGAMAYKKPEPGADGR